MGDIAHVPVLLERAFQLPRSAGRMAICRGNVKVGGRTIGANEIDMHRDMLADSIVEYGERSVYVNSDGKTFRQVNGRLC